VLKAQMLEELFANDAAIVAFVGGLQSGTLT
jgi:hypothetical protein